MDFSLTEEQALIRAAAQDFLAQASSSAAVRAALESPAGFDRAVWRQIGQEMGWCAITVPESLGGLGLGLVESVLVFEPCGRHLLCAPLLATAGLAAQTLLAAASPEAQATWLPRIASGGLRATAALGACGVCLSAPSVRARRSAGGWLLDGELVQVVDGASAELLIVTVRLEAGDPVGGKTALMAIPVSAPGMHIQEQASWDRTRRLACCRLKGVPLGDDARIDAAQVFADEQRATATLQAIEARVALLLAAEQLGVAQQCLDLTRDHVATRRQFGQPLAAFQAVKHRCAQMMVELESARSLVHGAAALADSGAPQSVWTLEAGAAKACADQAAFFCAQEAIQLHGGVGFTWEYDPQLYFKRAQAAGHWMGSADRWHERIARALLGERMAGAGLDDARAPAEPRAEPTKAA